MAITGDGLPLYPTLMASNQPVVMVIIRPARQQRTRDLSLADEGGRPPKRNLVQRRVARRRLRCHVNKLDLVHHRLRHPFTARYPHDGLFAFM